jgi:opacity protein-like surface antigen
MKKIALILCLLVICVAAVRAQESRQDVSISGSVLVEPFRAAATDVDVSANRAFGALVSYRFMLTPNSAVEANYGVTYRNEIHFVGPLPNSTAVNTRTQEATFAYVRSFSFRKFNPFVEAGAGGLIFLPIRNAGTNGTHGLDVQQQMQMAALFGGGIAYEITPSFDIRAEYRGLVTRVPTFKVTDLTTNKWYQIYDPVVGVAYHF